MDFWETVILANPLKKCCRRIHAHIHAPGHRNHSTLQLWIHRADHRRHGGVTGNRGGHPRSRKNRCTRRGSSCLAMRRCTHVGLVGRPSYRCSHVPTSLRTLGRFSCTVNICIRQANPYRWRNTSAGTREDIPSLTLPSRRRRLRFLRSYRLRYPRSTVEGSSKTEAHRGSTSTSTSSPARVSMSCRNIRRVFRLRTTSKARASRVV